MTNEDKNFATYEYKEVKAAENELSFYLDSYESFGWEIDERLEHKRGVLMLRRNRKISNKTELTRLQHNFEAVMEEINNLKASKNSKAQMVALTVGVIGTAFMAGATFAATAAQPAWVLCAILAVPGIVCWGAAPLLYKKLVAARTTEVNNAIKKKYDEIYSLCEKGQSLQ